MKSVIQRNLPDRFQPLGMNLLKQNKGKNMTSHELGKNKIIDYSDQNPTLTITDVSQYHMDNQYTL